MKLRSGSIDDALGELDLVLREQRTPAARLLRREAQRDYRQLHTKYLRLLRAVERGELAQRRAPCR